MGGTRSEFHFDGRLKGVDDLLCTSSAEAVSHQISGEELFWDLYLLPKYKSRPSPVNILLCVGMDSREHMRMAAGWEATETRTKSAKKNDMDNHG
jgi:hypothetical protein